eukprot:1152686-Pelagomonas_calceolata.AAC.1
MGVPGVPSADGRRPANQEATASTAATDSPGWCGSRVCPSRLDGLGESMERGQGISGGTRHAHWGQARHGG